MLFTFLRICLTSITREGRIFDPFIIHDRIIVRKGSMADMETINRAIQLVEQGNIEEAMHVLTDKITNANDEEKFMIVELYYEWGFFEQAIELLEMLLEKYPREGEIITLLAEINIELEKDDVAIDLLNSVGQDDPSYGAALIQLADLYQAQGLFEVSEQKLMEAKELYPNETVIDFALGELLFSIGQPNRAIPFYERVMKQSDMMNQISIQERLAESHASIGHYETALTYYEKLDSNDPDILFKYGFTAFQQKRHDIAVHVWKKLIEIDPHYHTVYEELAKALIEENLNEDAFEIVRKGIEMDEFNKELFFLAGQLAYQLQRMKESIDYVQNALALDQDFKKAVLLLVKIYLDTDQHEAIIALINDIKANGAIDPLYDWELAKAYNELEQYKESLKAYKEASVGLLDDSEFLKEYGYFLIEEGLIQEAIQILTKYSEMEPLDEDVITYLERLIDSNNG